MHGYFGIGAEGVGKPMNLGSLLRTAHAFGARFVFTVGAACGRRGGRAGERAGATVRHDRALGLGRFAERPLDAGRMPAPVAMPVFGPPVRRSKATALAANARPPRRDR